MENKKYQTLQQHLHLLLFRLSFILSVQIPLLSPGSTKGVGVLISVQWFLPVAHVLSDTLPLSPVSQSCMEKDNSRTEKLALRLKWSLGHKVFVGFFSPPTNHTRATLTGCWVIFSLCGVIILCEKWPELWTFEGKGTGSCVQEMINPGKWSRVETRGIMKGMMTSKLFSGCLLANM